MPKYLCADTLVFLTVCLASVPMQAAIPVQLDCIDGSTNITFSAVSDRQLCHPHYQSNSAILRGIFCVITLLLPSSGLQLPIHGRRVLRTAPRLNFCRRCRK
jgi:hypothetical protein